jgi:hypothetical protein
MDKKNPESVNLPVRKTSIRRMIGAMQRRLRFIFLKRIKSFWRLLIILFLDFNLLHFINQ